jgi:hypothetical protein
LRKALLLLTTFALIGCGDGNSGSSVGDIRSLNIDPYGFGDGIDITESSQPNGDPVICYQNDQQEADRIAFLANREIQLTQVEIDEQNAAALEAEAKNRLEAAEQALDQYFADNQPQYNPPASFSLGQILYLTALSVAADLSQKVYGFTEQFLDPEYFGLHIFETLELVIFPPADKTDLEEALDLILASLEPQFLDSPFFVELAIEAANQAFKEKIVEKAREIRDLAAAIYDAALNESNSVETPEVLMAPSALTQEVIDAKNALTIAEEAWAQAESAYWTLAEQEYSEVGSGEAPCDSEELTQNLRQSFCLDLPFSVCALAEFANDPSLCGANNDPELIVLEDQRLNDLIDSWVNDEVCPAVL